MLRYLFCALTCSLAKEVQLFPGPGLYSGIFVIYLQCPSTKCRKTIIILYALYLLYVLSTVNFVTDFVEIVLNVSNNSTICKNIIFLSVEQSQLVLLSLLTVQQYCLKLKAHVVIIPSILVIRVAYLNQSIYLQLISRF